MAILPIQVKTTGISQVETLDRSLDGLEKQLNHNDIEFSSSQLQDQ